MKEAMRQLFSLLFAIFCIATSFVSNNIMGAGMWFWAILIIGVFVGVSAYIPKIQKVGAVFAGVLSVISVCALALGLIACTIGGSFKIDDATLLLLLLFFFIAITGACLVLVNFEKSKKDTTQKSF